MYGDADEPACVAAGLDGDAVDEHAGHELAGLGHGVGRERVLQRLRGGPGLRGHDRAGAALVGQTDADGGGDAEGGQRDGRERVEAVLLRRRPGRPVHFADLEPATERAGDGGDDRGNRVRGAG